MSLFSRLGDFKPKSERRSSSDTAALFDMQPALATCQSRQILKDRMRADLRLYRDAVNVLDAEAITGNAVSFERAIRNTRIAQLSFEATRDRYNGHVTSHGCI